MKTKLLAIVLCLVALLLVCTLTACDEKTDCTHANKTLVEEVCASCTKDGTIAHYVCNDCKKTLDSNGKEISDLSIPAAHKPASEWSFADGKHYHACENCDAKLDEAACSGGTATCTEKAKCSVCLNGYGPEPSHSPKSEWKAEGGKHYHECENCDAKLDEAACSGGTATCNAQAKCSVCLNEYGDANTHAYTLTKYDDDYHWKQCTCGETNALAPHSYTTQKVTPPTCTEGGYTTYSCDCGHSYIDDETSPTDHKYDESKWLWDDGYHWHASTCGCTDQKKDYEKHSLIPNVTAPTCTTQGYTIYTCTCGYSSEPTDFVSAKGHTVETWVETAAVLFDDNKCEYIVTFSGDCTACTGSDTKSEHIQRHSLYEKTITSATCKTAGEKSKYCSSESCVYHTTPYETYSYNDAEAHVWAVSRTTDTTTVYKCQHCDATKTQSKGNSASISGSDLKDTSEIELSTSGGGSNSNIVIGIDKDIKDNFSGKDISISADTLDDNEKQAAMDQTALTPEQKEMLTDCDIFDFTLSADSFDGSLGGFATIRIPYTLKNGEDPNSIIVWYIDNGELVPIEAVYAVDENGNGYVTFKTDHFSYYTVDTIDPSEICEKLGKHDEAHQHVIAPTCTTGGYTVCLRCGQQIEGSATAPLGHKMNEQVIKEAACAENGVIRYTCADCDMSYDMAISAIGHHYIISEQITATCKTAGAVTYRCVHCNDAYTVTTPKLTHSYHAYVVAPTCNKNGYTEKSCTVCGDVVRMSVTEATGHIESAVWYSDSASHYHICLTCGEKMSESAHVPGPAATEQSAQTCTVCAYTIAPPVQHVHSLTKVSAVKTTCTEGGNIEYYTCSCGMWFTDAAAQNVILDHTSVILTADGHKAQSTPYVEPTCENVGYTAGVWCDVCKTYLRGHVTISAYGHDYHQIVTPSTCTEKGTVTYRCSHCGDTEGKVGENIDPLGHDYRKVVTAPTCTKEGYTTYSCTRCSHSEVKDKTEPLGHRFSSSFISDENGHKLACTRCSETTAAEPHIPDYPTATEAHGIKCVKCNYVIAEAIEHTHAPKTSVAALKATCTEAGRKAYYICACGEWFADEKCTEIISNRENVIIKALGHKDTAVGEQAPTCTENGYTSGIYCSQCEHWLSGHDVIAPAGHKPINDHDSNTHWIGCSECGKKLEESPHSFETVVFPPACEREGYTEHSCDCGYNYTDNKVPALKHNYGKWQEGYTQGTHIRICSHDSSHVETENCKYISNVFAPTCTKAGYTENSCQVCGHYLITDNTEALGHNYVNGICTVCGEATTDIEPYRAQILEQMESRYSQIDEKGWDVDEITLDILNQAIARVTAATSKKEIDIAWNEFDIHMSSIEQYNSVEPSVRNSYLEKMSTRWNEYTEKHGNQYNDLFYYNWYNKVMNAQSEEEIQKLYSEFKQWVNELENTEPVDEKYRAETIEKMNARIQNANASGLTIDKTNRQYLEELIVSVRNAISMSEIDSLWNTFDKKMSEIENMAGDSDFTAILEKAKAEALNIQRALTQGLTLTKAQSQELTALRNAVNASTSTEELQSSMNDLKTFAQRIVDECVDEFAVLRYKTIVYILDKSNKVTELGYTIDSVETSRYINQVKNAHNEEELMFVFEEFEYNIENLTDGAIASEAYRQSILNEINSEWSNIVAKYPADAASYELLMQKLIMEIENAVSSEEISNAHTRAIELIENIKHNNGEVNETLRMDTIKNMRSRWMSLEKLYKLDDSIRSIYENYLAMVNSATSDEDIRTIFYEFFDWINEVEKNLKEEDPNIDENFRSDILNDMWERFRAYESANGYSDENQTIFYEYLTGVQNARTNDEINDFYSEFNMWMSELEENSGSDSGNVDESYRKSCLREIKVRWNEYISSNTYTESEYSEYQNFTNLVQKAATDREIDSIMRDFNTWIKDLESGYYPDVPSLSVVDYKINVNTSYNVYKGDSVEKFIKNNLVGAEFIAYLSDGSTRSIIVTRDMIQTNGSGNFFESLGSESINIELGQPFDDIMFFCNIHININVIPDMSGVKVVGEYTVDPATPGVNGEWKAVLYENGYAECIVVGDGSEFMTYRIEGDLLYVSSQDFEIIMKINEAAKTLTVYIPKGDLKLIGTYNYYDTMIQVYGEYTGPDYYLSVFTFMGNGGVPYNLTTTVFLDLEECTLSSGALGENLYFDENGNLSSKKPGGESDCNHYFVTDRQKASCTYEGYIKEYCKDCGLTIREESIPMLPHLIDGNGTCINCGMYIGGNIGGNDNIYGLYAYTEIQYIDLPSDHGLSMEDVIEKYLIGTNIYVEYNQIGRREYPITWDMIEHYDPIYDKGGTYNVSIHLVTEYYDSVFTINVTVPETSEGDEYAAIRKEILDRMEMEWKALLEEMNGKIESRYSMEYKKIVDRVQTENEEWAIVNLYKYDFCNLTERIRNSNNSDNVVNAYLEKNYFELPANHGLDMHTFIEKYVIGTNLYIEYSQSGLHTVPIDWSMISYDKEQDISDFGSYYLEVAYNGENFWSSHNVEIFVAMDMTNAEILGSYVCDLSCMGEGVAFIEHYSNGYAIISFDGGETHDYYKCIVDGNMVYCNTGDVDLVLVIKDEKTVEMYDAIKSGEKVIDEFRADEEELAITVFGNYTGAGIYIAKLSDTSGDGYWLTMTVFLDLENRVISSEFFGNGIITIDDNNNLVLPDHEIDAAPIVPPAIDTEDKENINGDISHDGNGSTGDAPYYDNENGENSSSDGYGNHYVVITPSENGNYEASYGDYIVVVPSEKVEYVQQANGSNANYIIYTAA